MKAFGLRVQQAVAASGQFYCPKCNTIQYFQQKYAIKQIFNKAQLTEEYVECQVCLQTYQLDILQYNPNAPTDRLTLFIVYALESGISVDVLLDGLVCSGMNAVGAAGLMNSASERQQKACPSCGIEQIGSLLRCKQCNLAY